MKKMCFVTAARSEYGTLKWLIQDVRDSRDFEMQLIVTGAHLLEEQGNTIDHIYGDGINIDYIVDVVLRTSSEEQIAESMGDMAKGFAKAFAKLKPDYVVVLGDRYELLPVVNTAYIMRIPIIHISGGDVTEGALDDGIRNAVTMLAEYHFPGTKESAENIARMKGNSNNIWSVGEPGLDSFVREKVFTREELAKKLGLDIQKKWALMTYHPETKESIECNLRRTENCMKALLQFEEYETVVTYANADFGGKQINNFVENFAIQYPLEIKVIPSLGTKYLSFMKQAKLIVGNSSSGIIEAPFLGIPVINIGDRQKGRYQCKNIIQSTGEFEDLVNAIHMVNSKPNVLDCDNTFWGSGNTSKKILDIMKDKLR